MNKTVFWIGMALIAMQAMLAWADNHLTHEQVVTESDRPQDYSFFEHPIWVIDTVLVFLASYLWPRLKLDLSSDMGIGSAVLTGLIVVGMIEVWRRGGVLVGDHCSHGGVATDAGWVHAIFFYWMLLYFIQIYFGLTDPVAGGSTLFWLSLFFSVFLPLGVVKFSPRWNWTTYAALQVVGTMAGVWIMTLIRYCLNG